MYSIYMYVHELTNLPIVGHTYTQRPGSPHLNSTSYLHRSKASQAHVQCQHFKCAIVNVLAFHKVRKNMGSRYVGLGKEAYICTIQTSN